MTKLALVSVVAFLVITLAVSAPAAGSPPRAIEPRLSGDWTWRPCRAKRVVAPRLVEEPECGPTNISRGAVSNAARECELVNTQMEAVAVLSPPHQCIDAAVATLEKLAGGRPAPALVNDLAAAYIARAQRKDRASDFVRALASADRAVALAPGTPAPRFNQALALEALRFDDDAIAVWDELRRSDAGGWASEAEAHWTRLRKRRERQTATQWQLNAMRLPQVAQVNDRTAVAQLIAPYPSDALHYLQTHVLPAWAEAVTKGDAAQSRRQLHLAHMIAAALAERVGDSFALNGVKQIESPATSKGRLSAIQQGVLALAGKRYSDAEREFSVARSPFHTVALIAQTYKLAVEPDGSDAALPLLAAAEKEAEVSGYRYLQALIRIRRGHFDLLESRYLDSLAEYDAAEKFCSAVHDEANLGIIRTRKVGILRIIGHHDLTWREAFEARRYEPRIVDLAQRHLLLGETALSAVALGYPEVALRYQNDAIKILQFQLANASGKNQDAEISGLRGLLGVAFGQRAAMRGRLGDVRAIEDLREADRLVLEGTQSESARKTRMAQIREVEGQLLLHADPARAVEAFSKAYELASPLYYRTYSASLRVERAEARLMVGDRAGAEADLQGAVAELRSEERIVLQGRQRGNAEALWSPYFSRSRDAYARLIQQLMEEQKGAKAFGYSEQFRAYELLNLVRAWTNSGEPLDLQHIRLALPPATFLVEYFVLDKQTYAWLIGPNEGDFETFTFNVGNDQIAAWTADLAASAVRRQDEAFSATLEKVSAALVREPLARIAKLQRQWRVAPRVIFVPDSATHGIPFAALLLDPSKKDDYLIRHYAVAVAPSATVYAFSLARDRQIAPATKPRVLLVANPRFNRRLSIAADLHPLTLADAEAEQIGQTYASVAKILRLAHEQATVPAFFRLAPESTIIHFAGHAVASPDVPTESLLVFAPSPGSQGVLTAAELLAKLRSDRTRLFVLSACSTAGGVPVGAEGLAPLVRPILAAGVPGVIGSLWDIPEYEAKAVSGLFHRHYREGRDADVALQAAQRDMLDGGSELLKSPAVWGSFQMVGFASSPFGVQKERK